jgi:hypothetical protein
MVDNYRTTEVDISLRTSLMYAAEPLSRADIYVDATNGKILLNDAIIKHADANGKIKLRKQLNLKQIYKCRWTCLELLLQDQKI